MAPRRPRTTAPEPAGALPNWPAITRADVTECDELLPDQILLLHDLLGPESLKRWRTFMSGLTFEPARPAQRGEAARSNSRLSFIDPAFAERLWIETGLRDALQDVAGFEGATGLNANLRLYSYAPGNAFNRHFDEATRDPVSGRPTRWTLLVYITGAEDGVEGGETAFYTQESRKAPEVPIVVPLTRGTALLHRHGADCLPHEGRPVVRGTKLVLRSDVTF